MKERPILFSAPMVRALLAGTKTQTRRVVQWRKPEPGLNLGFSGLSAHAYPNGWVLEAPSRTSSEWRCASTPCPYGQPGDRLWVRETWSTHACFDDVPPCQLTTRSLHYWADGQIQTGKGRPSIHMPRWASRIDLEVAGVRVERLQDISEADAWSEGCTRGQADDVGGFFPAEEPLPNGKGFRGWDNARDWYADLWEEINGPDSWDANPWVWVVEFKVQGKQS